MKNIFKFLFVTALLFAVSSCEDNEKYPLPATEDGSFVTVVFDNLILDVTQVATTAITGTLRAPVANVASYELFVRRTNGGISSPYVPIYSTSTFPSEFSIDVAQLGDALGLDITDFEAGDRFDFQGTSTSTDGQVVEFSDFGPDLAVEPGQKQSYQFTSFISCPFSVEEAVGTYTFTNCGFSDGEPCIQNEFEVVAGEEPNSVVLLNPYNSTPLNDTDDPFAITIVVNPDTGIGSIAEQPAFSTLDYCCAGFEDTSISSDEGFYFSCTGTILFSVGSTLEQTGTGARFTFGTLAFEAQKN